MTQFSLPTMKKAVNRSSDWRMFLNKGSSKCDSCKMFKNSNENQIRMKEKVANTPVRCPIK